PRREAFGYAGRGAYALHGVAETLRLVHHQPRQRRFTSHERVAKLNHVLLRADLSRCVAHRLLELEQRLITLTPVERESLLDHRRELLRRAGPDARDTVSTHDGAGKPALDHRLRADEQTLRTQKLVSDDGDPEHLTALVGRSTAVEHLGRGVGKR